jgi:hypothetical protein
MKEERKKIQKGYLEYPQEEPEEPPAAPDEEDFGWPCIDAPRKEHACICPKLGQIN